MLDKNILQGQNLDKVDSIKFFYDFSKSWSFLFASRMNHFKKKC